MEEKTIVGIASAAGGGIGIIRVSGSESMKIVDSIFHPGKFNNEENEALIDKSYLQQQKSHTIHYGFIIDGNNEVVDEVMVSVMKAPATYTREDVVEINCHGGNYILQRVMQLLLEKGAFLAEPGEFTKRAFLNGRIDLSQAEAVMKMISSKNEFALQSAVKQLEGSVSKYIQQIREQILYEMGRIESALDDPEHYDLTGYSDELFDKTEQQIVSLQRLLDRFENGRMKSEGINTVIVGKPNAGKSSLMNILLDEDRAIVTDIAGTTRDAIDTPVVYNGREYVFIDTAGLRRKSKIKEELERYSIIRTVAAVERADVVILVIDATEGVTEQDAKIAGIAHERGKGMIIAVNKWDALEKDDKTIYRFTEKVRNTLAYMPYAELLFISAKTGQRLPKLFETIALVLQYQNLRVQTGVLNEIMTEAVAMQLPPSDRGKRLKIYYMTQVSVKPPTFVIFVNDKELMHFSYVRYLENKIRESFGFRGTPLKFIIRERKEKEQ